MSDELTIFDPTEMVQVFSELKRTLDKRKQNNAELSELFVPLQAKARAIADANLRTLISSLCTISGSLLDKLDYDNRLLDLAFVQGLNTFAITGRLGDIVYQINTELNRIKTTVSATEGLETRLNGLKKDYDEQLKKYHDVLDFLESARKNSEALEKKAMEGLTYIG